MFLFYMLHMVILYFVEHDRNTGTDFFRKLWGYHSVIITVICKFDNCLSVYHLTDSQQLKPDLRVLIFTLEYLLNDYFLIDCLFYHNIMTISCYRCYVI